MPTKEKEDLKLVELLEKTLMVNLYLAGANRIQIKNIVNVGTDKVDKIISQLKALKSENKSALK